MAHLGCRDAGADIREWRRLRLLRAGFDADLAAAVAAEPQTDLHSLLELVDRGCRPDVAARILAPLEDRRTTR
jgi:hypothetical protein